MLSVSPSDAGMLHDHHASNEAVINSRNITATTISGTVATSPYTVLTTSVYAKQNQEPFESLRLSTLDNGDDEESRL